MRWQPWVYFYTLLLFPFLISKNKSTILNYAKICFIGVYLWSGIHKLNPNFSNFILENLLVDFFKINDVDIIYKIKSIGYAFPIFEILISILLLFKKTKKAGVVFAIILHLFIIISIDNNTVIIPWNIFMMLGVLLLFYNSTEKLFLFKSKENKANLLHAFIIIIFLLPIGNFFNKWNTSLSFSLYSGKPKSLYILIDNSSLKLLDNEKLKGTFIRSNNLNNGKIIDVNMWSYYWLNVPYYSESEYNSTLIKEFCSEIKNAKFIETELPIWDRIIFEKFKTKKEKICSIKTDSLLFIKFNKPIKMPKYKELGCD